MIAAPSRPAHYRDCFPADAPLRTRQHVRRWNQCGGSPSRHPTGATPRVCWIRGRRLLPFLSAASELSDLPNPAKARAAIEAAGFVVSLEIRHSGVTELADVVFPVAPVAEKPGTFLDWEGRERVFDTALRTTGVMPDQRVLHAIAAEMGIDLGLPDADSARSEIHRLGAWSGSRAHLASGPVRHHAHTGTGRGSVVELANVARQRPIARRRAQPGGYGTAPTRPVCLPRPLPRSAPTTAITLRCRLNPVPSHYRWRSPNSRLEQSGSRSIHRVARSTKRSALPRVPW